MNEMQMQEMCQNQVDAVIDRMHYLCAEGKFEDAAALYDEIRDWLVTQTDHDVMSLDYLNDLLDNK